MSWCHHRAVTLSARSAVVAGAPAVRWPVGPPGFQEAWSAYYSEMELLSAGLLRAFALGLVRAPLCPPHSFTRCMWPPSQAMRALVHEIEVRNGPGQDLPEDWFNDKIDQVCASLCVRSISRQLSRRSRGVVGRGGRAVRWVDMM